MKASLARGSDGQALLALGWAAMLVAFIALRLVRGEAVINADELIPLKIADAMSARGTLDPNWRFADLGVFQYDSYNFYLYNVLAFLLIKPAQWLGLPALGTLRVANIVMQLAALWLARDALRRLGADAATQLFACALIAVAPGLVQDAYMARPESLVYLLAALLIWILTLQISLTWRIAVAGLVLGAGMAVKVTFASLGLLVLVPLAGERPGLSIRQCAISAAVLAICVAAGFAIAAPYAVLHPLLFLSGLEHLADQYRGGHPPHSRPVYSFSGQAFWILRYFVELYGPLILVAALAPIWLRGRARLWVIGLAACWLVLAFYFATQRVFFERNFAHGLLPLLLAAALALEGIRSNLGRYLLAAAMLLPMSYWSVQIAIAVRTPFGAQKYEAANNLAVTQRFAVGNAPDQLAGCGTIAVIEYNDTQTRDYVAQLQQGGFELIGHYEGRFAPLVTSTLYAYLDPGFYYLKCPQGP
jgi:hypothetical protein